MNGHRNIFNNENIVLKINWSGIKGLLPFGFIALYSRLVGIG